MSWGFRITVEQVVVHQIDIALNIVDVWD